MCKQYSREKSVYVWDFSVQCEELLINFQIATSMEEQLFSSCLIDQLEI